MNDRSADERYRRLVDHSPDAICVHESGQVVYANPAAVRWMGAQSGDDLVGTPIADLIDPESIGGVVARIAALRSEGDASDPSEAVLRRLDGGTLTVEAVSVRTVWEGRAAYEVVFRDLTAQKAAESTLRFQAALVEHVSDAIISTTFDEIVTSWNPAAATIYQRSAADAIGRPISDVVGAELSPASVVSRGGVSHEVHRTADGSTRVVRVSAAPMADGYALICTDSTALHRAEQHFRTVVTSLDEGVLVVSRTGQVESANPAACRILGVPLVNATSTTCNDDFQFPMFHADGQRMDSSDHPVMQTLRTGRANPGYVVGVERADGLLVWLAGSCSLLNPDDPEHSSLVTSFSDITAERDATRRLEFQATHDVLTGLPNRAAVVSAIGSALAMPSTTPAAVLFIDLDRLKTVNDTLGHRAGDSVLRTVGDRLRRAVRRVDFVGRLGGDEFVALLLGGVDRVDVDRLADRLHAALAAVTEVDGSDVRLGASIGVVMFAGGDPRTPEEVLEDADFAMYEAKVAGGGRTRHLDAQTRSRVGRH
jgi:diguanylate cyclase (GGDEF)-like protein/PAS domain S-box-containing protein